MKDNSSSLSDIISSLPLIQKANWLINIQKEMQALIPENIIIKCSFDNNDELVLLASSPLYLRRLSMLLANLQPVLDKYSLSMPKIIVIPNK